MKRSILIGLWTSAVILSVGCTGMVSGGAASNGTAAGGASGTGNASGAAGVTATGTGNNGPAGSAGSGLGGVGGISVPPAPFEPASALTAVRKVKNLLTGMAPTNDDVTTVASTGAAGLQTLISTWMTDPAFADKFRT